MNRWLIMVLFLAVMFLDGIVLPGLLGFRESFLTIIFFVIVLLYRKADLQVLILGVLFSGLAEFYRGLGTGTLMLPFLASAGVLFLLNLFFNVRSRILMIVAGVAMFIVFWESSILLTKLL
ncbi:MAG: hypothetical protein HYT64_00645 [Candidatus Yanofskybacteria bacterium]|nr:hypothetical protein [Candidatus Yanofskybacteria bacterium]